MKPSNVPNFLFIKLLLGFWLCSSLTIAFIGILPMLQQRHESTPLPVYLERILNRTVERIKDNPNISDPDFLQQWERQRKLNGKLVRYYLFDGAGRPLNRNMLSQNLRRFMLMSDEANHPISYRFKNELIFGPINFTNSTGSQYTLVGRLPSNRPSPWFTFLIENKLLTLGFAIILSGFLCGLLAWNLGKPLRSLRNSADALAAGDLTSRVNDGTIRRSDEIGQLARAFNGMANSIETMVLNQQRLMSDMSHELRTPLTRIQLSLALARKKGEQSSHTTRIAYEADQLEKLIGELLELSRVKLNVHDAKVKVGLSESLSQVLDDAEFEAEQQEKQIIIDINEDIELPLYPRPFSRAIENLLRNAIRYASSKITINAKSLNEQVTIEISDDGPGVDNSELEAIFKPFYRPQSARERNSGGWGLGLAITEAAISAHGGQIITSNALPHGLKVSILLPTFCQHQKETKS